jgi:hypothetical protein
VTCVYGSGQAAVVRGLLLDLLATGDRAGADAAVERFIARYDAAA